MKAYLSPGALFCGVCGHTLHCDGHFRLGQPVIFRCLHHACEEYDKPHVFDMPTVELKPA